MNRNGHVVASLCELANSSDPILPPTMWFWHEYIYETPRWQLGWCKATDSWRSAARYCSQKEWGESSG